MDTANLITEVVKSLEDLTSITGKTLASAFEVLAFAVLSIVADFAAITLSRAFITKDSVSISTLVEVSVYSFSISSVIALK